MGPVLKELLIHEHLLLLIVRVPLWVYQAARHVQGELVGVEAMHVGVDLVGYKVDSILALQLVNDLTDISFCKFHLDDCTLYFDFEYLKLFIDLSEWLLVYEDVNMRLLYVFNFGK